MRGNKNPNVMVWRSIQLAIGATPDGIPGPKTGAAIAEKLNLPSGDWKSIQRAIDVSADGIPGEETAEAIVKKLNIRYGENPWTYARTSIMGFSYELILSSGSAKTLSGACLSSPIPSY